jgi:Uma2 family endonuclease
MSLAKKSDHKFTYAEVLTWPDAERWELIDGGAYDMTPAPTTRHQRVVGRFFRMIDTALQNHPCQAFVSPIDVVLSEHDVVQPDIVVVCDPRKVTEENIQGAPDVVIEVLSPSTALKDKREKLRLWEKHAVPEYVEADPLTSTVETYEPGADGSYRRAQVLGPEDRLVLSALDRLVISLRDVFGP